MPAITTYKENQSMSNQHNEKPGKGVMYWEEEDKRKSDKHPDYKGFVILEMDYKAGEKLKLSAWKRNTSRGYDLIALSEDNWAKKQKMTPQEDQSGYMRREKKDYAYRPKRSDDEDVPF